MIRFKASPRVDRQCDLVKGSGLWVAGVDVWAQNAARRITKLKRSSGYGPKIFVDTYAAVLKLLSKQLNNNIPVFVKY